MNNAEALTKPGIPNVAHQHITTPRGAFNEGNSVGNIGELLEYEEIQAETKLEESASIEMENGEVGMIYVMERLDGPQC